MADTQNLQLDEAAVQAFAEKLATFAATLEPAEAHVLTGLLRRATTGEDDVAGYAWWNLGSSSGWANFLSSAMLGVVISEGMVTDPAVLEHFYGTNRPAASERAAEPQSAPVGAQRIVPAV